MLEASEDYPSEAIGNPKRMAEWDNAHKRADIHLKTRNIEQHRAYLRFKWYCEDNGLDTCHLFLAHAQADMEGFKATRTIPKTSAGTIVFNQQNTFISEIQRPRRISNDSSIGKQILSGTTCSVYRLAIDSYVLLKALHLPHSFCLKDFGELNPNLFKKAILRLKRRGLITPLEKRTCSRFYNLTPKFLMSCLSENTRVRHLAPDFVLSEAES